MFTPTTNLRLLSTPMQSDYSNTLWFPNVSAQTNYFLGKTVKAYESFNYIKKDNTITVPEEIDNLYNCNYIMYQNTNFGNKWFYAFIDKMVWASNGSTRLYVSTDCIQTWFFDITYYQSYVDRCHSDTDVAGDNIIPEDFTGFGTGGWYQVGSQDLKPNMLAIFSTTSGTGSPLGAQKINGIVSGSGYLSEPVDITGGTGTVNSLLNNMVQNGLANAISRIQQFPSKHDTQITYDKHPSHIDCVSDYGLGSYTPTNKKLLSGAFLTAYISLYGQEVEFNPEYISGKKISFQIVVDQTTGTIGAIVRNYTSPNNATISVSAVIPESTWAYNQYKNDYNLHSASNAIYVRRQKTDRNLGIATSGLDAAASAIGTVNAFAQALSPGSAVLANLGLGSDSSARSTLGNISSGLSGISSTINSAKGVYYGLSGIDEISQDLTAISESYNAPAVGGVAQSNLYIAGQVTALSYGFKVPPLEIVKRCDKFLSVYGYKQSVYRKINLHARASWTYIKTNGLNASGNFPDDDMNIIKRVFDRGVFFWSYTAQFGNFDQSNGIV